MEPWSIYSLGLWTTHDLYGIFANNSYSFHGDDFSIIYHKSLFNKAFDIAAEDDLKCTWTKYATPVNIPRMLS